MSKSRAASVSIVLILSTLVLSACSVFTPTVINCEPSQAENDSTIKVDVVAVLAPSDSFTNFKFALEVAESGLIEELGWQGSRLSTILADGSPEIKKSTLIEGRDNEGDGRIVASHSANQLNSVYGCAVQDPALKYSNKYVTEEETDFLQAFTIAARAFDATAENSKKRIIVLGNGLQSVGQVNFAKDGLPKVDAVPRIISALESQGALPDLNGATVDWVGIGQTDGSAQEKLNQQSQDALFAFWNAFITASNGRVGVFQAEIAAGSPREGSLKTSKVLSLPNACIQTTLTSEEGFNFMPDTATFVDLSMAKAGANRIADELKEKPDCTGSITVVGYTASGVSQSDYKFGESLGLSLARAEAFKKLLVDAGVKGKVEAIGGGKGPTNDWDSSGKFSEDLGKKNRIVVITQQ